MALLVLLSLPVLFYISYLALRTLSNYRQALELGIPVLLAPTSWQNPVWALTHHIFTPILARLPYNLGAWTAYSTDSWPLYDRNALHARHGAIFAIVTPYTTEYAIGDPRTVAEVSARWRVWTRPVSVYGMLGLFGPNLIVAEGDDWQRHRKITSVAFTERNNAVVWAEAQRQARGALDKWTRSPAPGLNVAETLVDVGVVTLHVLCSSVLGQSYPFAKGLDQPKQGHAMSYHASLETTLHNLVAIILVGLIGLPRWMLSTGLKDAFRAKEEFQRYMEESLDEEKKKVLAVVGNDEKGPRTLLSAMVLANEVAKKDDSMEKTGGAVLFRKWLSDEELYGNLFLFNAAGDETTANSLAFSIAHLAAHPEVQDWVAEEINQVLGAQDEENDDGDSIEYGTVFPRLTRCLAVMHEQLRLCGAAQRLPRSSGPEPQSIEVRSRTDGVQTSYVIPPHSLVTLNLAGIHVDSNIWGDDALEFNPRRWIRHVNNTASSMSHAAPDKKTAAATAAETLQPPLIPSTSPRHASNTEYAFFAWSAGPRVCPGKKFSQVEWVAVMATLLRRHRVRVMQEKGESEGEARERAREVIQDFEFKLTPKMRRAESVRLEWIKR